MADSPPWQLLIRSSRDRALHVRSARHFGAWQRAPCSRQRRATEPGSTARRSYSGSIANTLLLCVRAVFLGATISAA